ncbi:MAG: DNA mismatch repair endonuclease MutL [Candidatus Omnitrophota bacterium]
MKDSRIKILSDEVICKIAAGEVVERPASVVKELVENSIDAGSCSIEIDIELAGKSLIRVADNGEGILSEDVKIACLHHATSKISEINDLGRINTLGFRGEALSSISSVSQMDIITCSKSSESGVSVYLERGEVLKLRPVARIQGTTIEVRNLFYNVPARRKFLKKESSELSEIVNVVGRFILAYPNIEFKLKQVNRTLLHAPKGMNLKDRIKLVLGGDISDHMQEISDTDNDCKLTGFVSKPSTSRKDRRGQIFFVNGRFVKSKTLSDAVYAAYYSLLEKGRYPAAVLFLNVSSEKIDVNVHPAKLEVKFEDENFIKNLVRTAIKGSFNRQEFYKPVPAVFNKGYEETSETNESGFNPECAPETQTEFSYKLRNGLSVHKSRWDKLSPVTAWEEPIFSRTGDIFQVGKGYIVQVKDDSMKIFDQHAAHERVLFEFFTKVDTTRPVESQKLLFPVRLDVTAEEAVVMEKVMPNFSSLGFSLENFGEKSFIVQAVPAILKDRDVKTVIMDILSDLLSYSLSKSDLTDEFIKLASCRSAIKSGDELNRQEMVSLMSQLAKCELPFTCPHGRPTMFEITLDELEKRFRRK